MARAPSTNAEQQIATPWAPAPVEASPPVSAAPVSAPPEALSTNVEPETIITKIEEEIREVVGEVVEMVTVTVPKAFKLRIDNFRELNIKAGVQEMEAELANHWYSKANGVEIYKP